MLSVNNICIAKYKDTVQHSYTVQYMQKWTQSVYMNQTHQCDSKDDIWQQYYILFDKNQTVIQYNSKFKNQLSDVFTLQYWYFCLESRKLFITLIWEGQVLF